ALAPRRHHLIRAVHRADRGLQGTEARVLERLAGAEHGLLAHHAGTAHRLHLAVGVRDDPLPAHELDRLLSLVGDADAVGEEVLAVRRRAALGDEGAMHLDAHAASGRVAQCCLARWLNVSGGPAPRRCYARGRAGVNAPRAKEPPPSPGTPRAGTRSRAR